MSQRWDLKANSNTFLRGSRALSTGKTLKFRTGGLPNMTTKSTGFTFSDSEWGMLFSNSKIAGGTTVRSGLHRCLGCSLCPVYRARSASQCSVQLLSGHVIKVSQIWPCLCNVVKNSNNLLGSHSVLTTPQTLTVERLAVLNRDQSPAPKPGSFSRPHSTQCPQTCSPTVQRELHCYTGNKPNNLLNCGVYHSLLRLPKHKMKSSTVFF